MTRSMNGRRRSVVGCPTLAVVLPPAESDTVRVGGRRGVVLAPQGTQIGVTS